MKVVVDMHCQDCPYNETYPYDFDDSEEQDIWCDKVGGKIWHFGRCSDADEIELKREQQYSKPSKRRRKNKRERDEKYKRHLKWIADNVSGFPWAVYYVEDKYIRGQGFIPVEKPYYKRTYYNSRYYKRYANRVARRYKGEIHRGNAYRKIFDYRWAVW
jgi:hypothetical protein